VSQGCLSAAFLSLLIRGKNLTASPTFPFLRRPLPRCAMWTLHAFWPPRPPLTRPSQIINTTGVFSSPPHRASTEGRDPEMFSITARQSRTLSSSRVGYGPRPSFFLIPISSSIIPPAAASSSPLLTACPQAWRFLPPPRSDMKLPHCLFRLSPL